MALSPFRRRSPATAKQSVLAVCPVWPRSQIRSRSYKLLREREGETREERATSLASKRQHASEPTDGRPGKKIRKKKKKKEGEEIAEEGEKKAGKGCGRARAGALTAWANMSHARSQLISDHIRNRSIDRHRPIRCDRPPQRWTEAERQRVIETKSTPSFHPPFPPSILSLHHRRPSACFPISVEPAQGICSGTPWSFSLQKYGLFWIATTGCSLWSAIQKLGWFGVFTPKVQAILEWSADCTPKVFKRQMP